MKIQAFRVALLSATVTLTVGCASTSTSTSAPTRNLRNVALITSGDIVSYTSMGSDPAISLVDVDGKPVAEPHGLIELVPGTHSVTMKCYDTVRTHKVTVRAGEVYQFNKVTKPGVRGCVGALSRVRSARR